MHVPAPLLLYCPGAHWEAVGEEEPAGQAYPAVHAPLHALLTAPGFPKRPGSQLLQTVAAAREYCPAGH